MLSASYSKRSSRKRGRVRILGFHVFYKAFERLFGVDSVAIGVDRAHLGRTVWPFEARFLCSRT